MHEYLLTLSHIAQTKPISYGYSPLILVAILGLIVGSYLNVVIYRGSSKYIPSNYKGKLTVASPKHSFCPECLHTLSWLENIPLISWIIQLGKCKHCKAPISIQYPIIEASNALTWLYLWLYSKNIAEFITYSAFVSILIAVTVIDIKTLKIPNKITLTGIAILIILNLLTQDLTSSLQKALAVLGAAIFGYLLVELGKLLFGKKTVKLKTLTPFKLDQVNKTLTIQEEGKSLEESEAMSMDELFLRPSDSITIGGEIDNVETKDAKESLYLTINGSETTLESKSKDNPSQKTTLTNIPSITGQIKEITMPQEALGMGDVKLLMLIAAALGFPNFIYAMTIGAITGLAYALILRIVAIARKTNPPSLIAFGPWLSLGSLIMLINTLCNK